MIKGILLALWMVSLLLQPQPITSQQHQSAIQSMDKKESNMKTYSFKGVVLDLEDGYSQKAKEIEKHKSPFIPGEVLEEAFASWEWNEKAIRLFVWTPRPWRDGGPMETAESWEIVVAGAKAKLIGTKMFFGIRQKVLVVHFQRQKPEQTIMMVGENMERGEFQRILSSVRFEETYGAISD